MTNLEAEDDEVLAGAGADLMQRKKTGKIIRKAHARVGLLGNPSDGYYGKTISFSLKNFAATVTLTPSETLRIVPHPEHDPSEFPSLRDLVGWTGTAGYYGGVRLLLAACKRFHDYCAEHSIDIPDDSNFTLSYDTDIPRQAGLSGSSAIVCAALSCLFEHYAVNDKIPIAERPSLALSVEEELGITAGLQDRVIQVYGGLVYMDFDRDVMTRIGGGIYEPMDPGLLPPHMYVVYSHNPEESGKVHSNLRRRWIAGETSVVDDLNQVASFAEQGRTALKNGDTQLLAALIDRNFDYRRKLFGDAVLGCLNIKMVEVVRSVGAASKFTGSGGAVLAFCPEGSSQSAKLKEACAKEGFECVPAIVAPSLVTASLDGSE
ncbi:hypothetical protein CBR_g3618 [Chara braunii]|uniref:GHMP kinase N-terminal domain-containing protein n=1 Tax=Chara braunii TaxID=69332 RepID=A0A388KFV6_CHABU|nr:hypothetical protein CBR_g3618 [Chara braunii]|eukprot:GBG68919.1 hypothetical protein CBR_g3618 [Chara braunii]